MVGDKKDPRTQFLLAIQHAAPVEVVTCLLHSAAEEHGIEDVGLTPESVVSLLIAIREYVDEQKSTLQHIEEHLGYLEPQLGLNGTAPIH